MLNSQEIGSSLVSFRMIFYALQSELFRFKFYSMSSKILKNPGIQPTYNRLHMGFYLGRYGEKFKLP